MRLALRQLSLDAAIVYLLAMHTNKTTAGDQQDEDVHLREMG